MNIVIQGGQGCGKTTTAEHIAMMYHSDRVAFITEYPAKKLCFDTVKAFLRNAVVPTYGYKEKALIVFDNIPNDDILHCLISHMNDFKKQFVFVDTLYITQLNIEIS